MPVEIGNPRFLQAFIEPFLPVMNRRAFRAGADIADPAPKFPELKQSGPRHRVDMEALLEVKRKFWFTQNKLRGMLRAAQIGRGGLDSTEIAP